MCIKTGPDGSVVEHSPREGEVVGSNSGPAIPKALKMVPVAALLGTQHYKASTGFSFSNKYRTTSIPTHTKKSEKESPIIINVCIHQTIWKIGSHAKYGILFKYRDYYKNTTFQRPSLITFESTLHAAMGPQPPKLAWVTTSHSTATTDTNTTLALSAPLFVSLTTLGILVLKIQSMSNIKFWEALTKT